MNTSATSWIAAGFCLVVCGYMLYQHQLAAERDPWKSPQLLALKERLRTSPADESVKQEIRRLDLEFRQRYVRRLSLDRTGGWLLVGGLAVFLVAARQMVRLRARPWLPRVQSEVASEVRRTTACSRYSVTGIGLVVGVSLLTLALTASSPLPDSAAELDRLLGDSSDEKVDVSDLPIAVFQVNWPAFRGFDGSGTTKIPLSWKLNGNSNDVVIWKTSVPARGFSSPVVWSNLVFLSGGDATRREVLCYSAAEGQPLWRRPVENTAGAAGKAAQINDPPGYAAPTMATDGHRAFVLFANGELAAFNFDGSTAWTKQLGTPRNIYGHSSSLAIWPGSLIVQWDQDEGAPGGSKLLALDCATGRSLWERSKPTHDSWASPILVPVADTAQIITLALPWVMSHSVKDGNEVWRAELMEGEITPSPVFAGGKLLLVKPTAELIALRPDGAGDVSHSHVAWRTPETLPDVTSPVSTDELVFTVTSGGLLACFDLQTGGKVWEKELELEVQASPAIAGKELLVLGTKGEVLLIEAARTFKELGRTKFEDEFFASPAFAHGRTYLRGNQNLWCLGVRN